MFNNWLKRRDDNDEKDDELSLNEEQQVSGQIYSNNDDDDYYYYYYYEGDNNEEPTIPNLNSGVKTEEELEFFDSKEDTYLSPFKQEEGLVEDILEDVSYEEDFIEPINRSLSQEDVQTSVDQEELVRLKEQLTEALLENESLKEQASRLSFVEEDNKNLSNQIKEYADVIAENNDLKERLLEMEQVTETSEEEAYHIKELDSQLAEAQNDIEAKEIEISRLTVSLNELTTEKETVLSTNNQLKEELEKATNLLETLKSENAVFVGKLEELQNNLNDSNEGSSKNDLIIEENIRLIKELEAELEQAKKLETELINRFESEIESNQLIMKKNEQELSEMNERISQTEALEKELAELRENQKAINELQKELTTMRQQQVEVTTSLTELASEKNRAARLEQEVSELKSNQTPEVSNLQMELAKVKEELKMANLRAEQSGSMNQSDIAHVMLEAQAKARQIVDVANYEAKRRVADSEMELSAVSQEARNYYRKLEKIKAESEVVFSELLRKLESIGDIDRL